MFVRLEKITINTNGILWFNEERIVLNGGVVIESPPEKDYKILANILLPKPSEETSENETQEYFNELHKLVGGTGKVLLTTKRRAQLNKLLKTEGFTKETLKIAAKNIGEDDWLQGANDNNKRYGDIDYLLRPEKAAQYLEKAPTKKPGMF